MLQILISIFLSSTCFGFDSKLPTEGKWVVTGEGTIGEFLQFVGDFGAVHSKKGQAFFKHEFGDQYTLVYAHINRQGKYSRQRLTKDNLKCTVAVVRFEGQDKIILRNLETKRKICDLGILEKENPTEPPPKKEEQPAVRR